VMLVRRMSGRESQRMRRINKWVLNSKQWLVGGYTWVQMDIFGGLESCGGGFWSFWHRYLGRTHCSAHSFHDQTILLNRFASAIVF
jgi:hypothetical protein